MRSLATLVSLAVFFLPANFAMGGPPVRKQHRSIPEPWISIRITRPERVIVTHYIQEYGYSKKPKKGKKWKKQKSLPPGLAKKVARGEPLPPGWRKKLVRGELLPASIYSYSSPLPPVLVRRLPPPPPGTILVAVDGKIVRLIQATLMILDVFDLGPYGHDGHDYPRDEHPDLDDHDHDYDDDDD